MKKLLIVCATGFIIGCAHKEDHFTPPSSVEVQRHVARVGEYVRPEGKAAFTELQKSLADYQTKVEQQTTLLAKAENDASYWHNKQIKALKELWVWRMIALITILCVVLYVGARTAWTFRP